MTNGTHFHILPFYVNHHPAKRQINANFIASALSTSQELLFIVKNEVLRYIGQCWFDKYLWRFWDRVFPLFIVLALAVEETDCSYTSKFLSMDAANNVLVNSKLIIISIIDSFSTLSLPSSSSSLP